MPGNSIHRRLVREHVLTGPSVEDSNGRASVAVDGVRRPLLGGVKRGVSERFVWMVDASTGVEEVIVGVSTLEVGVSTLDDRWE